MKGEQAASLANPRWSGSIDRKINLCLFKQPRSGQCWFLQSGSIGTIVSSQYQLPYFLQMFPPSHPHHNLREKNVLPSISLRQETLRWQNQLGGQVLTWNQTWACFGASDHIFFFQFIKGNSSFRILRSPRLSYPGIGPLRLNKTSGGLFCRREKKNRKVSSYTHE